MSRPVDRGHWARAFFTTIDSGDVDRIAEALTSDVRLTMGNGPPIVGRDAVREAFVAMNGRIRSVEHAVQGIWSGNDADAEVVSVEATVTYTLPNARRISIPVTSTLRLEGDRVRDYRIFIDTTPVFGTSP